MKKKFSLMWRATIALVMVLSLNLVTAAPAVAQTAGTISLDQDWYKTGDTVTVTIEDADLDVLQSETLDPSSTIPDDSEIVFSFAPTDIEFAVVNKPYDMRGDQYLVQSVNDATGEITLQAAPPTLAELRPAITVADGLSLIAQPTRPTVLKLVMSVGAAAGDADQVVINGIVGGSPDSETVTFVQNATVGITTKLFDSVDSGGIDALGYTVGGDITINADNFVFADYTYYGVETFEGSVVSSVDATGVTPEMTETGAHTGIFEGTLVLAASTNDGSTTPDLMVADGGTITAVYDDIDPVVTVTVLATVDDTAPSLISQSPADGAKINDTTPVVSVDVLDFESGVLGDPTLVMAITGPGGVSPVQTAVTDGYHLEYNVGTGEALSEGTITVTITGEDIVGNSISSNSWTFDIDLSAPTMDDAATATTTTVEVNFNEELDDDTVATGDFLVGGSVTPTEVAVAAAVVTLTVPEMPTDATPTVALVGAVSDIAGNELTEPDDVTASDGVGPTVAIAVSPDPAGAEGDATFDLTFNETMKTSVALTVEFTRDSGTETVTGGWTTTTTWQGAFDISSLTDQEFASVVTVTLGEDLAANVMAEATGSFDIDTKVAATFSPGNGDTIYTASPVVRISFGEVVTITAATFDDEDVLADLVTSDNMTFRLITEVLAAGSYTITVSAEDQLGNTSTSETATFTVAAATSYDIALYEGWNLISLPLVPDNPLIDAVLSGISGTVSKVWAYDAQTEEWSYYVPDPGIGELGVMRDGVGYWFEMSGDATLTLNGSVLPEPPNPPQSYDVYEGWNLIGSTTQVAIINEDYLASVLGDYTHIWGYDVSAGYFVVYTVVLSGETMSPGMGYWIWMTADGVIVPPLL